MKISVVLFNLGGPDQLSSVRGFLFNLFNDRAIISLPWPFRTILAWWISKKRAPIAAKIYEKLGGSSPILPNTQAQMQQLQRQLGPDYRLRIAMRYWHPFTKEAAEWVKRDNPDKIILLPLYPQYSTTTSGSSIQEWHKQAEKIGIKAPSVAICCYPIMEGFLKALARSTQLRIDAAKKNANGKDIIVIFSAHGLPQRVIDKGDPYQYQMEKSADKLAQMLGLAKENWILAYQSKVGRLQWLEPATDKVIEESAKEGKAIIIVPLAFVSEHSETLVELDIEYKELAEKFGASGYWRVPTVGVDPDFISGLADLIKMAKDNSNPICSPLGASSCRPNSQCPLQLQSQRI